ncbi:MAG: N-formylglutamate amidohydrolase [Clostridia bacterium]|nr:N-formylglutamate amidohydrolase [Clostridia bacterium]
MNKIFLHIPHSGERLPKNFFNGLIIAKKDVTNFKSAITDAKTDKLFGKNHYKRIKAKYSRIFCDVEKYADDEKEEMSKFGMGVIYTTTNKNVKFAQFSEKYKQNILKKYYYPYHERLDKEVNKLLLKNNVVLIDCHSFSKDIIMFDERKENLPDICVGYNAGANQKLIDFVCEFLEGNGYKVSKNYPYSGSMVPNNLSDNINGHKFESIMIEVNKITYLFDKNKFKKLQNVINQLLKKLEDFDIKK